MTAYIHANVNVHDPVGYREYTSQVEATLAPFGGRFLVRAGEAEMLEGSVPVHRTVLLAFPDLAAARAWYASPAYQAILPIRHAHSTAAYVLVMDGVPGDAGAPAT